MVATFKAQTASSGDYFVGGTSSDYYVSGGDPAGQWFGLGASELDLSGDIAAKEFNRIWQGKHPRRDKSLVNPHGTRKAKPKESKPAKEKWWQPGPDGKPGRKPRAERVAAYDIPLQLDKQSSSLWALLPHLARSQMDAGLDTSAKSVMTWLENNVRLTRRGKGGCQKEFAKLIGGMFDHATNRELEPHRHRHCVIMNTSLREDGSGGSVNSGELRKWVRTLGPLFRSHFAAEMRERLGIEFEFAADTPGKRSLIAVPKGIPKKLADRWSSRKGQIEQYISGQGIDLGNSSAQARQIANLKTRKNKGEVPPRAELFEQWEQEAAALGFTKADVGRLLHQVQPVDRDLAFETAWKLALFKITTSEAHFTYREVLQHVAEEMQVVGMKVEELTKRVKDRLEHSPEIVPLAQRQGEMRYTTQEMWQVEERLIGTIRKMRAQSGAVVPKRIVERILAAIPEDRQQQREAIKHALTQDSALRVITGVAGSGKSYAVDAIRQGLEMAGYNVIGTALAGCAKEELARQGHIASRTLESLFQRLDKSRLQKISHRIKHDMRQLTRAIRGKSTWKFQDADFTKRTVLIVDEVGMVDARSMERLLAHAAKRKITVIPIGDEAQLPPILAGGVLKRLQKEVGKAHLSEHRRQRDPEDRKAVEALRAGKAAEALASYDSRGRVTVTKDRQEAIQKLVAEWVKEGGLKRPQDAMIFTQTRQEARVINALCQQERLNQQKLPSFLSVKVGQEKLMSGDRVLFHAAYRPAGIENGYRGTIQRVDPIRREITVQIDQPLKPKPWEKKAKQTVTIPVDKLKRQDGKEAITLGSAATTHKMQGQSVPKSFVLAGGLTDKEMSYVQMTRGSVKTLIFVDDAHAGEKLCDLAKAMTRSRAKDLAHDVVDERNPRDSKLDPRRSPQPEVKPKQPATPQAKPGPAQKDSAPERKPKQQAPAAEQPAKKPKPAEQRKPTPRPYIELRPTLTPGG